MQDDQGANVLHIAAELNQSAAIVLFLETGTGASDSLDSKDRAGVTPLHRYPHSLSAQTILIFITWELLNLL